MQNQIKDFQSDKNLMKTLMDNFGSVLVFVFYSDANEESKQLLEKLSKSISIFGEFDNVKYFSLSAERCPQTFKKFEMQTTPTVLFTQTDKKILHSDSGKDLGAIFDDLARIAEEHKVQFQKDRAVWHPKVKNMVESCPFIVFIKGTPENPKCGFTRTLLEIMKENQVEFTYYDIIEDEQMRYWARHYSGWPTYPQLFINGKLIGGLDKLKELVGNGEFAKILPGSCKVSNPAERYAKFISQHETIIFTDGFTFESEVSAKAVEEARTKYGDQLAVYNTAIDKSVKDYILAEVSKSLPFVVHQKQTIA